MLLQLGIQSEIHQSGSDTLSRAKSKCFDSMAMQPLQDVVHGDIGVRAYKNGERHLPMQLEKLDSFDDDPSFTLRVVRIDSSVN